MAKKIKKAGKAKNTKKQAKNTQKGIKKSPTNEKQGMIIVGIMVGLLVILIVIVAIKAGGNKFTYEGIDFKKIKYGEIELYSAQIPITDSSGNVVKTMEIDFRNNPKDLKYIDVNVNEIGFYGSLALLSVEDSAESCEDNGLALLNLGGIFLKEAQIAAKITYLNQTRAEKEGIPYVTCENTFNNTVIEIKEGQTTAITQPNNNCYQLTYTDCEIMMVTEKFQLEMLKQAFSNK